MKTEEFLINQHRITFVENGIEIEEFDDNDDFVSRVFLKHNDFKILIGSYRKYEKAILDSIAN